MNGNRNDRIPPFLGLPTRGELGGMLLMSTTVLLLFCLVYGGTDYLTGLHTIRFRVFLPGEPFWRFIPSAAPIYLSLNFMLALALFILRTRRLLLPLMLTMMAEILVAGIFHLLVPMRHAYPEHGANGVLGVIFTVADTLNLHHNDFPSLHVCFSITCAAAYSRRAGPIVSILIWTWAGLLSISTLLVYEHHIMDVISGALLAGVMFRVVYRRAELPGFQQALKLELACLHEFSFFIRRHRRYAVVFLMLYYYSLGRWRATRGMRCGYCFLQYVDDVLDGDRRIAADPLTHTNDLLRQIESGHFHSTRPARLARCLMDALASRPEARAILCRLLRNMQYDRRRVVDELILTEAELAAHHRETFEGSLELLLITSSSTLRAADAGYLVAAFGWCSVMRDLDDDLARGLINIPAAVVAEARKEGVKRLRLSELGASTAFRNWLTREHQLAVTRLERFEKQLQCFGDQPGSAVFRLFHRSIKDYAVRRYPRQFRGIVEVAGVKFSN